jgi:glycosyltransferase involved in cell wall biosynthesis
MLISVVSPCYNERKNLQEFHRQVTEVMQGLNYDYEILFIDNASKDGSVEILRELARNDEKVKVILNTRNFGHIRSPYYGLLQAKGNCVVAICSDLQESPQIIKEFVKQWELGYKIVVGVKIDSEEGWLKYKTRCLYYKVLNKLSENPLIDNFMGFGLFDKKVIEILRKMDDPYPYLRGLIAGIGFDVARVPYKQAKRKNGKSHNNFYTLFDIVMLGLTNNSKVPLRVATIAGLFISAISFLIGVAYLVFKLIDWQGFNVGLTPLIIGMFFLGGIQILFLGLLGEYIGAIYTQVLHRPLVIEKERINFD